MLEAVLNLSDAAAEEAVGDRDDPLPLEGGDLVVHALLARRLDPLDDIDAVPPLDAGDGKDFQAASATSSPTQRKSRTIH